MSNSRQRLMDRLESVVSDLRFGLRHLRRKPLTTTTILLVLALGIGANSAIFSVVQAFTSRPAPAVPRDDRHVRLYGLERVSHAARWRARPLSYVELRELAARSETLTDVAAWVADDVVLETGDGPRTAQALFVTPNYFTTLGVQMARGPGLRVMGDAESMTGDVVISDRLWEELFARSAAVIGRAMRVNDVDVRIVGVAPPRFLGALPTRVPPSLWLTLSARTAVMSTTPTWLASADSALLSVFGRLAPGASLDRANTIAQTVAARTLSARTRVDDVAWTTEVFPLRGRPSIASEDAVIVFGAMGTVALLILLVACTNVSSLLVAAGVARRQEIAVRLSLGASRVRIVRQLLTESVLLAIGGGAAGLLLYWWLTQWLSTHITHVQLSPDLGTLGFTLLFAIGTGVVFGLSPAMHAVRSGLAGAMRDASRGSTRRSRLQRGFVIAQIALTQPLLVILAVLLSAAMTLENTFPGESVGNRVAAVRFRATNATEQRRDRIRIVGDLIAREPEVTAVLPEPGGASSSRIEGTVRVPARRFAPSWKGSRLAIWRCWTFRSCADVTCSSPIRSLARSPSSSPPRWRTRSGRRGIRSAAA